MRHGERCSEVQVMIDHESEVQCGDEAEESRADKSARDPGAPATAEIAKHAVSHWPYRSWCPPTTSQEEAEAGSAKQTRAQRRRYQC